MSQMNKGLTGAGKTGPVAGKPLTAKAETTFKKAVNTATVAKGKLDSANKSLASGKEMKKEGLARMDRANQNAGKLPGWANQHNKSTASGMIKDGKAQVSQAKKDIKANTPKGPTIGAGRTPNAGPKLQGAGKVGAPQGAPIKQGAVTGAKTVTPFKQASPSNPMGRMGGKPGVNIGTSKFK